MAAIDDLRDQVAQAQANVQTLLTTISEENAQVIQKIQDLEGQILNPTMVQELTSGLQTVNAALADATTAVANMVTPEPPPQP